MKFFSFLVAAFLFALSCNMQSCQNSIDPDEKQKADKDSVLKFISIKVNNKTFNPEKDTLKLVPCDTTKINFVVKDFDKIWKYNITNISDTNDSSQFEVSPVDSGLITIKYFISSSVLPGNYYNKHIGFIDLEGNYYKLNLKIKVEPYIVLRLFRGECFGSCKSYEINIFSDRSVKYIGYSSVKEKGTRFSSLTAEKYDSLINQFNLNNFLNLNYNQLGLCTDLPIRSLKFNYNCNINYTLRQEGCSSDVPDNLIYLEKLVDEVTNSKQWTE